MTDVSGPREPWTPPRADDLGTTADARNQQVSFLDGRGLGHRQGS